MNRPVLLDLFCGAGGATRGYQDAGFYVVGVDINPQPSYCGDEFVQMDALRAHGPGPGTRFDAIHASPPCQFATAYKRRPGVAEGAVNLIPRTRALLERSGLPYVIENVEQARPHLVDPVLLCGSSFGLDVRRHRLFETNWPLEGKACDHSWQTPRFPPASNRTNLRRTVEVGVYRIPLATQRAAMGIDWMTLPEPSQAIPPAFTSHIGAQLRAVVEARAAA